ncbi:hypothetical protein M2352_003901 [Azospirillum fermentarium]|uniref:helix-turn-helix domain containing protein n=1 Tax=Azospirillum fermentarium TaxID=1233114 RepID=UPI002227A04F|nr:helix-turn-helix domain containing protein [Azospirillum fermentarium]MCW2248267.1 hypothetical protein [Azospirillum fermentarium]
MNTLIVERITRLFGGQTVLSAAIDVPQSTIAWWKKRGSIPPKYWPAIIAAAAERGVILTGDDFLRLPGAEAAA